MSKSHTYLLTLSTTLLTSQFSQNPAVMSKAAQCFTFIAQALEAETLQGQMAQRIVGAGRKLIATAGLDANQLLGNLPPETQQTVRAFFG